jgi:hypothetical protein
MAGGKAVSAITLIVVTATEGTSIPILLGIAIGAIVVWILCADRLGLTYASRVARPSAA